MSQQNCAPPVLRKASASRLTPTSRRSDPRRGVQKGTGDAGLRRREGGCNLQRKPMARTQSSMPSIAALKPTRHRSKTRATMVLDPSADFFRFLKRGSKTNSQTGCRLWTFRRALLCLVLVIEGPAAVLAPRPGGRRCCDWRFSDGQLHDRPAVHRCRAGVPWMGALLG